MLLNDFFEIIENRREEGKIAAVIKLNAQHKIYAGHFPGNPVTPGVVQLQIVKEILESTYKKELKLASMRNCKFMKILNPNVTPLVTIDISSSANRLEVSVIGKHHEDIFFKLTALFSDGSGSN